GDHRYVVEPLELAIGVRTPYRAQRRVILAGRDGHEILMAALRRVPLAVIDMRMAELDPTGTEIVGDKQRAVAPAVGRIDARARLRNDAGVGVGPAIEPGRRRFRRPIGPESDRPESALHEGLIKAHLPELELAADLRAEIAR